MKKYQHLLFGFALTIALFLIFWVAARSYLLVGKNLPGFLVFNNGQVFSLIDNQWTGAKAGLKKFDRITHFDGQQYVSTAKLNNYVKEHPQNKPITYRVIRDDQILELEVPVQPVTWNFSLIYLFLFPIGSLATVISVAILYLARPNSEGIFAFFLTGATLAIFKALFADMLSYQDFLLASQLILVLYGILLLKFFFTLVQLRFFGDHQKPPAFFATIEKTVVTFFSTLGLILAVAVYYTSNVYNEFSVPLNTIGNILFFMCGGFFYSFAIYSTLTISPSLAKKKQKILMTLVVASGIPFITYSSHNLFHVLMPIELSIIQSLFPVWIAYVFLRLNFLHVNFVPERKTIYLGLGIICVFLFFIDIVYLDAILEKYSVSEPFKNIIIYCSMLIKALALIKISQNRLIDRMFFPSTFKFRQLMQTATDQVLNQRTTQDLFEEFQVLIQHELGIEEIYIYFLDEEKKYYQKVKLKESIPNTLPQKFKPSDVVDEITGAAHPELRSYQSVPETTLSQQYQLELYVPMYFQNNLVGFVLFGKKPDQNPYNSEDLLNLESLVTTLASAVLNLRHFNSLKSLHEKIKSENLYLKSTIQKQAQSQVVIGKETTLKPLFDQINSIRHSDIFVMITGETGSGKEVIAQAIHDSSKRANQAFIKLNCSAIPATLFESELFGHEKGAFTGAIDRKIGLFELADKGTLFLDEIGEVPLELQAKLLRAIQEQEIKRVGSNQTIKIDVRILSATNRNLKTEVKNNRFREDLYYRLNVMPLYLPPLRERTEDIEEFIYHYIDRFASHMNKTVYPPNPQTIKLLKEYDWPGNVRELRNIIERSVTLTRNLASLQIVSLEPKIKELGNGISFPVDFQIALKTFKKTLIKKALEKNDGDKQKAAEALSLHVASLYKLIKQLGV